MTIPSRPDHIAALKGVASMRQQAKRPCRLPEEVRAVLRRSPESARVLSERLGINPKTILKWRARADVSDAPPGRNDRALTTQEEAIVVSFRTFMRLPLDDLLYAMQLLMPRLTRSTLHRCLQRYGASGAFDAVWDARGHASRSMGSFRVNVSATATIDGPRFIFVGIDPVSKLYFASAFDRAGREPFEAFLQQLGRYTPYAVRDVVMQESTATTLSEDASVSRTDAERRLRPICAMRSAGLSLTGDVVPNKMFADSHKRFYVRQASELDALIEDFLVRYNFHRRLKTIGGRTPFRNICAAWDADPNLFAKDPHHHFGN